MGHNLWLFRRLSSDFCWNCDLATTSSTSRDSIISDFMGPCRSVVSKNDDPWLNRVSKIW